MNAALNFHEGIQQQISTLMGSIYALRQRVGVSIFLTIKATNA